MELTFTLKRKEVPVTIETSEGTLQLTLFEMTAGARDQYLDLLSGRMGRDGKGQPIGLAKFDGMQAELLAKCLVNADGSAVTAKTIQGWPASVVSQLFTAAQKLNHLSQQDPKEEIPEKKE